MYKLNPLTECRSWNRTSMPASFGLEQYCTREACAEQFEKGKGRPQAGDDKRLGSHRRCFFFQGQVSFRMS